MGEAEGVLECARSMVARLVEVYRTKLWQYRPESNIGTVETMGTVRPGIEYR